MSTRENDFRVDDPGKLLCDQDHRTWFSLVRGQCSLYLIGRRGQSFRREWVTSLVSSCHCGALTGSDSCGSTQNISAVAVQAHDLKAVHFTVILRLVWTRLNFFIRCSCGPLHTFPDVYRPIMPHLIPNDIMACKLLR